MRCTVMYSDLDSGDGGELVLTVESFCPWDMCTMGHGIALCRGALYGSPGRGTMAHGMGWYWNMAWCGLVLEHGMGGSL